MRLILIATLLASIVLVQENGRPVDAAASRRADLVELMEEEDFTVEPNEWWHYNYQDWREYPILDIPFSAIGK